MAFSFSHCFSVFAFAACAGVVVGGCSGSSSSPLLGPATCPDPLCLSTEPDPAVDGGANGGDGGVNLPGDASTGDSALKSDAGLGGPCKRDAECGSGVCNWELERCMAGPAPDGTACRRDTECAGELCNWELGICKPKQPDGGACRRDTECAGEICNWEQKICLPKQPAGQACRRDVECISAVCNTALDACQ